MGDVDITIGGKDDDAQKAWDRQQRQIAKLKEAIADLKKTNRQAGDEAKKTSDDQITSLAKQTVGLFAVSKAVGFVTTAYGQWAEKMAKLAEDSNKFHGNLLKTLNRAGDLASGGEIKAALRSIPGTKQEDALAAFAAVSNAAPQSELSRRLGVTKSVARMAPLANVGALGDVAGELSDIIPNAKPEDIADLAVKLQEQAGGDAEKLSGARFLRSAQTLAATGATDIHGALAFGAEALRQNQDPRLVDNLAVAVGSENPIIKSQGRPLTADEKLKNKFQGMSKKDRLNALMTDADMRRAVMPESAGQHLDQMSMANIDRLAAEQRQAMAGDEVGKRLAQAHEADPSGMASHQAAVDKEQADFQDEEIARRRERAWAAGDKHRAGASAVGRAASSAFQYGFEAAGNFFGADGDALGVEMGATPEAAKEFSDRENAIVKAIEKQTQEMKGKKPVPENREQ